MSGLREALGLEADAAWPENTALHTEEARAYFLRLVSCMHGLAAGPVQEVEAPLERWHG